ncbi:MAG TPA: Re/Si-specific NAD(P)(+) transhydrogenase subunit alpha [Candidatus Dormibacteraeota bacterium]|nr:Re/Si-specific NAD(P)(+) transhydrogenase subunit alpha [Candidatus Dormibacteraeota bacterium]
MKIAVPRERVAGERRVALTPEAAAALVKTGLGVVVERGAGEGASFSDEAYTTAGASIAPDASTLYGQADVVLKVQRPVEYDGRHEVDLLREGSVLIALLDALTQPDLVRRLAARRITAFGMEGVPRISRAQKMDALSSQANIAGYRAALIAAQTLPKFFPMLMTAAGTVFAARVLVIGAGVAGLQAIATARRLGAQVWGYDVRPVVKEQVESLGAKFLAFDLGVADAEDKGGYAKALSADASRKQQEMLAEKTKDFDAVITTALVPGKAAPRLITKETVAAMRPGSVIVDLAAESGGNCELSKPDEVVVVHGVTIHGPTNLPATMPVHASQLYARNVTELLNTFVKNGELAIDLADEVIAGACVTHAGEVVSEAVKATLPGATA